MARRKQKAVVDKYFVKTHRKNGMLSNFFECVFCKKCYAYNSCRLAQHLLRCTKTGAGFASEKMLIESLFISPKPKPRSVPTSVPVDRRERKRKYDKQLNNIKLAAETRNSVSKASDTFKSTGSCTADNSTPKLTTNFYGNRSNASLGSKTTKSNYTSKHLSTSSSVVFNDHHISISPDQVINFYIHEKKKVFGNIDVLTLIIIFYFYISGRNMD